MNCPSCQAAATSKILHSVTIDECSSCEGIWFDSDEMRIAKDSIDADLNWLDPHFAINTDEIRAKNSQLGCPKCKNQKLVTLYYDNTNIEIDLCCGCHGMWLQKGELEKIIEQLEQKLLGMTVGDYAQESLREIKEIFNGQESVASEWRDLSNLLRLLQYKILSSRPVIQKTLQIVQANPLNN